MLKVVRCRIDLGTVCRRLIDLACTNHEFAIALDQDPAYIPAHLAIAEAELDNQEYQGAESHVAETVRSEPGNLRGLLLYTRVLMAQRAVAANGSNAAAQNLLGRAWLGAGNGAAAMLRSRQFRVAVPSLHKALEAAGRAGDETTSKAARSHLAEAYAGAGDPRAAAKVLPEQSETSE